MKIKFSKHFFKEHFSVYLLLVILLASASCTKKDSEDADRSCTAGDNGDVTIVASPTHHGAYVQALSAYIKFNAQDYPGNSAADYDLVVPGNMSDNKFYFNNLHCGPYYVYATAIDTVTNDTLSGGIPIQPTLMSGEFDIILHVSE